MGDVAPPGSYRCRHRCHYRRETDAAASRTADHTHAPQSLLVRRRPVSRRRAVLTFVFISARRTKTQLYCLWCSLDCYDNNFYNVLIPTYLLFIFLLSRRYIRFLFTWIFYILYSTGYGCVCMCIGVFKLFDFFTHKEISTTTARYTT